ncbi:uncharacterized protein LOC141628903 [Silene latifolia]|uniref:uncharacterized protein LOC141628903 n=1 Tax=Silene latifolia TaxID=37657 RepID=UPI003D773AD9
MLYQLPNSHLSGHDEDLLITNAKEMFKSQNKNRKFSYIHSWKILRVAQKWKGFANPQSGSAKRTRNLSSGAYTSSSSNPNISEVDNNVEVIKERPIGQKAAKEATRNKGKAKKAARAIDEKWNNYKDMQDRRLALCEDVIRQKDE